MLKKELDIMIKDLENHHRSKDELLEHYVKARLDKSLEMYYKQLLENYNTILNTYNDDLKMVKKLVKGM